MPDRTIRVAIAGVGNCASSLIQGVEHYRRTGGTLGLVNPDLGGYKAADIKFVAAFDIDERKVNRPLEEAMFAKPNCTMVFQKEIAPTGVTVRMAPVLDGVSPHMAKYPKDRTFAVAQEKPVDVAVELKMSGAEILLCYVPVGSEDAAKHYAKACLEAGVSLVNCMPVFIVSNPEWAAMFEQKKIPCVGDDVKSQLGATILHRVLVQLFGDRGVVVDRTYQLNTGGNTDFLNMLNRDRLASKKESKTAAVRAFLPKDFPDENIHIGPSDYVPWQNDNKISYIRIEGREFGGVPIEVELKLSDEDSPNSGGVVIDAIRYLRLARDRGIGGPLYEVSALLMKHPPKQMRDAEARRLAKEFVEKPR